MTYSIDFRKKVLAIKEKEKLSFADVSKRFGVGKNTIFVWSKKLEPQKNRNKPAFKIDMQKLKEDIEQYSDAYQYERAARLGVSRTCIWYALKRLKVTYKKSLKTSKGKTRREIRVL
jgi:transposase